METLTGGQWIRSDNWIDVYDPADVRRPAARVPAFSAADAAKAYDAAAAGFTTWRAMSPLDRARIMFDAAALLRERADDISEALLADGRIAAVTFTGSNDVGEKLRGTLAARNVRFQAEMGGKNATVVLRDLTAAAGAVVAAAFGQAGQRCTATSRVIVDRPVSDAFTDVLQQLVGQLRVGRGGDPATTVGPLVSPAQRDGVTEHVAGAVEQGARVIIGAEPPAEELRHGCYLTPTILAGVTTEMDIWHQEVFGPVIVVSTVDGPDDAIGAVNDSTFGLAAAVFTRDLALAHRFADEVECGQIAVNTTTTGWDVHHPFGGFRDSGSAFKEQGEPALNFYTRVKTVAINYGA